MVKGKSVVHICSFDNQLKEDATEPVYTKKMSASQKDIELLKVSKRISVFWITEGDRRANLVQGFIDSGRLVLDNSCGFPWSIIVEFKEVADA